MTDPDLAWAAGLFEGEGCFAMSRYRGTCHLRARMAMTDEEPIRRFASVVAFGTVTGPHAPAKAHWKPYWVWQATGNSVVFVFALLEANLSERRKGRFYELWSERLASDRAKKTQLELVPRPTLLQRFRRVTEYLERSEAYYATEEAA